MPAGLWTQSTIPRSTTFGSLWIPLDPFGNHQPHPTTKQHLDPLGRCHLQLVLQPLPGPPPAPSMEGKLSQRTGQRQGGCNRQGSTPRGSAANVHLAVLGSLEPEDPSAEARNPGRLHERWNWRPNSRWSQPSPPPESRLWVPSRWQEPRMEKNDCKHTPQVPPLSCQVDGVHLKRWWCLQWSCSTRQHQCWHSERMQGRWQQPVSHLDQW